MSCRERRRGRRPSRVVRPSPGRGRRRRRIPGSPERPLGRDVNSTFDVQFLAQLRDTLVHRLDEVSVVVGLERFARLRTAEVVVHGLTELEAQTGTLREVELVVSLVLTTALQCVEQTVQFVFEVPGNLLVLEGPQVGEPPGVLVTQSPVGGQVVLVEDEQRPAHVVQLHVQFLGEFLVGHLAVRGCRRHRHPLRADQLVEVLLDHGVLEEFLERHYGNINSWPG